MARNIEQVFAINPITSCQAQDLIYIGQYPYGTANDAAIQYQNFIAQFSSSITGTAKQVLANGTSGTPQVGNVLLTTPQNIDVNCIFQANSIKYNSLIAGYDSNGNPIIGLSVESSAVNYPVLGNGSASNGVLFGSAGTDTNIVSYYLTKGTGYHNFQSTNPSPIIFSSGTAYQHVTTFTFANTANTRTVTFPDATGTVTLLNASAFSPTNGFIPIGDGATFTSAALTAGTGISIANASGSVTISSSGSVPITFNADSGSATPSGGALTISGSSTGLTTTGSGSTIGLTGTLNLTSGGTNNALTASNGGIVWSDASKLNILSGTATANLPLLSGSTATPAWGAYALSLGGTFTTAGAHTLSGAFASTFTFTNTTTVTFPTSGTLATTSQLPTPAALTESNDTNVTMTLGGTPSTALLQAVSMTLGWTGQLSLARGGTNANLTASNGGIFYSTASAGAILSGTATANQMLLSGASGAPAWSTATHPATTTINQILYSSANNVIAGLATANSSVLVTSSGGVPSLSTTLPTGLALSTPASGTLTSCTGLPISTGVSGLGSGVATVLGNGVYGSGSLMTVATAATAWTPAFTFATVGDLSVAYTTQTGFYVALGKVIHYTFQLTFTPTFTTSSSNFRITGLPSATAATIYLGTLDLGSAFVTYPTGCTSIAGYLAGSVSYIDVICFGSATAASFLAASNVTSGHQISVYGTGYYWTA